MAQLKDLPEDIFNLFDPELDHEIDEDNLERFCDNLKNTLRARFRERNPEGHLRFSNLGKPDRQLWYDIKDHEGSEVLTGKILFKFLYGDVIEELILFLAREAGHDVSREQEEVEVEGVKGHIDAIIDGVVVDVKSASPFGFQKFENGGIHDDDAFGYIPQISGYANVLTPGKGAAFVAFNKVDGDICIAPIGASVVQDYPPGPRIEHVRGVLASDVIPERCYSDVEDGKSGNRKLAVGCSYCRHKHKCWPNLRTFLYSGRPRFLTRVEREPNVPEMTN